MSFLARLLVMVSIIIFSATNPVLSYGAAMITTTPISSSGTDFINASCRVTLYPRLCFKSLQFFSSNIGNSPRRLAHVALAVSLFHVNRTLVQISNMSVDAMTEREDGAIADCIENVGDSVYEIQISMRELRVLGRGDLMLQINNIQTWMSAALTDEDTCIDGLDETKSKLRFIVRRMVRKIEKLTSNSLALFNSFAAIITKDRVH